MRWLFIICLGSFSTASEAQAEVRPNTLFLFANDWGRYASIYGQQTPGDINDVVKTLVFDKITKQGVLFNQANVSAPSSSPCRTVSLTGHHFWQTSLGVILRVWVFPETLPTFPGLLRDAGYHIGYSYKVCGPTSPAKFPFTTAKKYMQAGGRFNQFHNEL